MKTFFLCGVSLVAISTALVNPLRAADLLHSLPSKAPPPAAAYDWSGFYLGGHLGYALGSSRWSSSEAGISGPSGSVDFANAYNFSTGNGSYLLGFQAGYDAMTASHWLVGAVTDISFPSFVGGNRMFTSALVGQADYLDRLQISGTLRGRVGYAAEFGGSHWLFYATGGFAWSYDQFSRIQVAGVPAAGTAVPGTVENQVLKPRAGGAAGAGVELALPAHWSAQLEYLLIGYPNRSVTFPLGAQRFDSDLLLNELRFGLNYRFNGDASQSADKDVKPPALQTDNFAIHAQTTLLWQYDPPFHSPYRGANSLIPNEGRETWDATAFLGARLWDGAEFWINPEIDQGFGLSSTEGVAGFPSGEAFKRGESVPYARVPRAFIRQTINLSGDSEKIEAGANKFSSSQTANRLVFTVGKFSITDIFDNNKYAHDPKQDFMNWALIDSGTFDYAGDAWGMTYGAATEWYQGKWTVRSGLFDLSADPGSTDLDTTFRQFQWVGEIERRYELWGQSGKLAVTGFLSRGRMGKFADAIALVAVTGGPADITAVRRYSSRAGVSMNLEQQITEEIGLFARAGVANGDVEPFDVTDIDRTAAAGVSVNGKQWHRPNDTFAVAAVVNGISGVHRAFLNDGGLGLLVGDGMLPHPGPEQIIETYYQLPVSYFKLTLDYQFIRNPAYNRDRGPVSVIGARLHSDF